MARNDQDSDGLSALPNDTRRGFLLGSAGAVGGLALAGTGLAEEHEEGGEDDGAPTMQEAVAAVEENPFEDDVDVLNYALSLERLEAAFYEEALEAMDQEQLFELEQVSAYDEGERDRIWGELATIRDHEQTHADAIVATLEELDAEPAPELEFDFGNATQDPQEFLDTAILLEDTGVGAYAGAAPYVENQDVLPAALGIHSVEARHASYLRSLNRESGYPEVVDEPLARGTVLERAAGFIVDPPDAIVEALPDEDDEGEEDRGEDDQSDGGEDDGYGDGH